MSENKDKEIADLKAEIQELKKQISEINDSQVASQNRQ